MTARFSTLVLLEAAQNYDAMFADILKRLEELDPAHKKDIGQSLSIPLEDHIAQQIKWARRVLKKQDRVVWWLRHFKVYVLFMFMQDKEVYLRKGEKARPADSAFVISSRFKGMMEHFFSLDYVKIQDYVFGTKGEGEIREELKELEREYVNKVNSKITDNDPSLEGTSTLIDFGNGWHWISLNRAACDAEGKAMGHCGNSPRSQSDENILSLRKLKKRDDGTAFWEPHLTFTINEGGEVLEMKGRGNQKPAERYHPMIVELLLHEEDGFETVQELRGGEWLPENDFSLDDLSEKLKNRVLTSRPELGDLFQYVEYGGDVTHRHFVQKVRQYHFHHPLIQGRSPAWFDWELVDGKLQYNLVIYSNSILAVAFGDWSGGGSLLANEFTVLSDDPVMDLTYLMNPEEADRFSAGYEKHKVEIDAFREKKRPEAMRYVRAEINERLAATGLGEVRWPEEDTKRPRSLPVTITDSEKFVAALQSRIAPPMRDFISALKGISIGKVGNSMSHKLRAYDDGLYREFMAIINQP